MLATVGIAIRMRHRLKFRWVEVDGPYAVVRLVLTPLCPNGRARASSTSVSRTTEELSIVCPAGNLPRDIDTQHHWICFKLSEGSVSVLANRGAAVTYRTAVFERHSDLCYFDVRHRLRAGAGRVGGSSAQCLARCRPRTKVITEFMADIAAVWRGQAALLTTSWIFHHSVSQSRRMLAL